MSPSERFRFLDHIGSIHVVTIGSINLDLIATGAPLPRPGETVLGAVLARSPGGKGANQAVAARGMGAEVAMVGAVGADLFADEALMTLRAMGVHLDSVAVIADAATGVALIAVDAEGENQISVASGANARLGADEVTAGIARAQQRQPIDAVLCVFEIPDAALIAATQAPGLFAVNVAPARPIPPAVLTRADVILVNELEHEALADQLAEFDGLIVTTLGAAGAEIHRRGTLIAQADAAHVDAVDTVGAGDAFCGSFVTALAAGADLPDALEWANAVGGLTTTRPGAQPAMPGAAAVGTFLSGTAGETQRGEDRHG